MDLGDVWIHIEGYERRIRGEWERTRTVCYTTAAVGSDRKKFPSDPRRFMPFPWDKQEKQMNTGSILEQHAKMVARREMLKEKAFQKS